ncbi:hypothetical protein CSKR_106646 [Clonorchis sinensis]|uniref:Uncharacterized protein n=1 Tax=Clonorchis sinensis TaxID=79923 RepID=A0A3R7FJ33_CLOSI|nr:hypothetical protein CSKR_106646 [Clonorchis sinensis]
MSLKNNKRRIGFSVAAVHLEDTSERRTQRYFLSTQRGDSRKKTFSSALNWVPDVAWTTVRGKLFHAPTTRNEKKFCPVKLCTLGLKTPIPCLRRVLAGSTVKDLLAKPCSNKA